MKAIFLNDKQRKREEVQACRAGQNMCQGGKFHLSRKGIEKIAAPEMENINTPKKGLDGGYPLN